MKTHLDRPLLRPLLHWLLPLLALLPLAVQADKPTAWGFNHVGQLGTNNYNTATAPVNVFTAGALNGRNVTAVSAGQEHSCAIADARVFCWGSNFLGQLGNGTNSQFLQPVGVHDAGLNFNSLTSTQISVGRFHTCAVASGRAYCWGQGADGQLGNNGFSNTTVAVPVTNGTGPLAGKTVVQVATTNFSSCALTSEGKVACWGFNGQGALGNGTFNTSTTAVAVGAPLSTQTVVQISGRNHRFCAVTSAGSAYCWGGGFMGNGQQGGFASPVLVSSGAGTAINNRLISQVSVGLNHSCVIADGLPFCWGQSNGLGNGTSYSTTPVAVSIGSGLAGRTFTHIAAGGHGDESTSHSCAIANSRAYCWGDANRHQLGIGITNPQLAPVPVSTGSPSALQNEALTAIALGGWHNLALSLPAPQIPTFGASGTANTTATLNASVSLDANLHYLVVAATAAAPTQNQIRSGGSGYASAIAASGTAAMSAGVAQNLAITGLSPATSYTVYGLAMAGERHSDTRSTGFSTPNNVDGACGAAHGAASSTAPASGLCTAGTATAVAGSSGAWRWSCTGLGTGTTASCLASYATQSITGFAASPDNLHVGDSATLSGTATSGLPVVFARSTPGQCSLGSGSVTALAAGTCTVTASQPGTGDSGSSRFLAAAGQSIDIPVRQNGVCGAASGVATATAPDASLCAAGAASLVSGSDGAWRWSCNGLNGGTSDSSCAAAYASQTLSLSAVPTTVPAYSASTLTGSSSAGLVPTLSSSDASVCLFSSTGGTGNAYGVAEGICNVTANQAGTGDSGSERYLAAAPATVGISITPACVVEAGDNVIDRRSATSAQTITGVSTKRNVIWGSAFNDTINGGAKGNCIDGGPGADRLSGNNGDNQLFGGLGNDTLTPGAAGNFLDGGPGTDRCLKASSRATATTEDCETQ